MLLGLVVWVGLGLLVCGSAVAAPVGAVTEFPIPTANSFSRGIAAGPDGNMWFTENGANKVGRITPAGTVTEFAIPTAGSGPFGIAAGPDGNMWFTETDANQVGRVTPAGTVTEFPTGGSDSYGIAAGADGNMWFTEFNPNQVGRVTPAGTVTEFTVPTASSDPFGIAAGADGNMWFTEETANKIGLVGAGAPAASVRAPSVTGSGEQGTQQVCQGDQWAQWDGQPPSYGAFSFDGYQWLRDGSAIAGQTSQSYTPVAGDVGHKLSCTITVSYPLPFEVTTSATSTAITVIPQNSGPQGPAGSNGATGSRGPAGKVELVTCKTVVKHGKKHQSCTTKLVSGPVKFTKAAADTRAALSRDGVITATGYVHHTRTGAAQIRLLATRRLPRGRYTLTLTTQRGHRKITTRTQVTLS